MDTKFASVIEIDGVSYFVSRFAQREAEREGEWLDMSLRRVTPGACYTTSPKRFRLVEVEDEEGGE